MSVFVTGSIKMPTSSQHAAKDENCAGEGERVNNPRLKSKALS